VDRCRDVQGEGVVLIVGFNAPKHSIAGCIFRGSMPPATTTSIFEGLNQEQCDAVKATRGPVVILAGAGSGKTTTITRRIANQVAIRDFAPAQVLAVTFTDKAAGQMRTRLAAVGVTGVNARTFHSAALAQLRYLSADPVGEVMASKAMLLRQIANSLPVPFRYRPVSDLATEIEWAKNLRIGPSDYRDALGDHQSPIPGDLMAGVFREYERRKNRRKLVDFEDLLELTIRMYEDNAHALATFQQRYLAFTVDEYQDVNLLQNTLLERWLGERNDICAVGDDYQSIYGFTGASPGYLLDFVRRYPAARIYKLETNYRSTPQVLEAANRLVPFLGGTKKTLRAQNGDGPSPDVSAFADEAEEVRFVGERIIDLRSSGVPFESIAVLYRVGFRAEAFADGLGSLNVPYQVRDGAFLTRMAARRVLSILQRSESTDVAVQVRRAALSDGWQEVPDDDLSERELTRQKDLARLVGLAIEFDDGRRTTRDFASELQRRFSDEGSGKGVHLLTYHRAKGLEFDAVFLPRLNEGELPYKRALNPSAVAEERRLLYVGMTRARRRLTLTYLYGRPYKPSRFLRELSLLPKVHDRSSVKPDPPAAGALRRWRKERAREAGVPAYVVFNDKTLEEIARKLPGTMAELASVSGIGPLRIRGYGDEILRLLKDLDVSNR
jgi:DNA helicase II / ATP-dependent DNA helicase PcrA